MHKHVYTQENKDDAIQKMYYTGMRVRNENIIKAAQHSNKYLRGDEQIQNQVESPACLAEMKWAGRTKQDGGKQASKHA